MSDNPRIEVHDNGSDWFIRIGIDGYFQRKETENPMHGSLSTTEKILIELCEKVNRQSQRIEELEGFINKYDEWAMTKDGSSEEGNAFVEMVEARQVLDKE